MTNPTISFDVSSEVPLDTLAKEVLPLLQNQRSYMLLNPRGPAGGNTEVLIFIEGDLADHKRIVDYMVKYALHPFDDYSAFRR